jgi:hypothetical protein
MDDPISLDLAKAIELDSEHIPMNHPAEQAGLLHPAKLWKVSVS